MNTTFEPLLAFIAQPESRGDYEIVWGGISAADRPPRPLTTMTIGEVLEWQDSIDAKYMSEAAGAYQILEDTLRDIYRPAGFTTSDLFDEETQDALAIHLMRRRGLDEYMAGKITVEAFCNRLAREWASLPVVTGSKRGRSYYGGDGLNKAHVAVEPFMAAVRSIRAPAQPPTEETTPQTGDNPMTSFLGTPALVARLVGYVLFGHLGLDGVTGIDWDAATTSVTINLEQLGQVAFGGAGLAGLLGWRHIAKRFGGKT